MSAMRFEQLGFAIRRCRELRGLTVSELAAEAGIHRNTLSAYEAGKSSPAEEMFIKLCLCLGMNAAEVFAAACIAKLQYDLCPLEARLRSEAGLPEWEVQDKPPAERYGELLRKAQDAQRELSEFEFEQQLADTSQRTLVRLRPSSLQDLPELPKRKRVRKSKKAKSVDKAQKVGSSDHEGEDS